MKILVRLPNWLGDMVMAVGFIRQLERFFPGAEVSVIAKKGIDQLLPFFPPLKHRFVFNKEEYGGLRGLWKFGRSIRRQEKFDLFFCLPDSFSSAFMGQATGSKERVGYKKEMRQIFLTHSYTKPAGLHRVEEYVGLLERFTGRKAEATGVFLHHNFEKQDYVVANINSEASSRRLTADKAVEMLASLRTAISQKIILVGAPKEKEFVEEVMSRLPDRSNMESVAGKTSLSQLAALLASARLMFTTDSGPAHLANALGTQTIVLFGAGNENNTAPYNADLRTIIRLGQLSCEPCTKNVCVRYGLPQCLERLDTPMITATIKHRLEHG
ncbi:MAG TPA: glycosyltransferase family 9 protein [Flavisolibacter sp.]|jgi:lipopolysaccharide heptosyltransferase II